MGQIGFVHETAAPASGRATLEVTWGSLAMPWVRYRVSVDGVEVARVRYGRPARFEIAPGHHDVHLSYGRRGRYRSELVGIEATAGACIALSGRTRRLPGGM